MAIIRWKPFNVGQFLSEDFPEFRVPTLASSLATDVYEKGGKIVAEMNLPGIDPETLDIVVEDNYIHITGSREEDQEEKGKNYYYKEIQRGSFERTVRLPSNVKKDKAEAIFEDGVLKIEVPKVEERKTQVRIKANKKSAAKVTGKRPVTRARKADTKK